MEETAERIEVGQRAYYAEDDLFFPTGSRAMGLGCAP
jgi:hypothetical protein